MNRRDFLTSREMAEAAKWAVDAMVPLQEPRPADAGEDAVLMRFSRRAMATTFEVMLPFGDQSQLQLAEEALDLIDQLESQLTVYRNDSEVSEINARAHAGPVEVEPGLFELLQIAQHLHRETEGAFDIATGALTKVWGFFRREGRVPSHEELADVLQRVGMQHVHLDATRRSVRFDCEGIQINLGSIGKGYAVDRVARQLWTAGVRSTLIHGGQSSVIGVGTQPGQPGWIVGMTHPWHPERRLGLFTLKNRGLGTSSASQQFFEHEGKKLGHILDPRSGWPAQRLLSVSVTAPTATQADALATAFFILGSERAHAYCQSHPEIGAVVLTEQGQLRIFGQARTEFATT